VTIAARSGGDPNGNPRLRLAISKAKEANMPGDTLKKAVQRGTGELPGVTYEEFALEGYGPGGTAMLIEITSDNRNRTVAEIRNLLTKGAGNMAEAGAVSWQFHKKGLLTVDRGKVEEDQLISLALDAGAEDVKAGAKSFEVITDPHDFENVKKALADAKIDTALAEVTFIPQNSIRLEEKNAEQMLKLMEILDEHDDVQKVHANFDISDEVMEKVAAAAG
jgi:YebC/PmpR family DNA-binding regulatory protein